MQQSNLLHVITRQKQKNMPVPSNWFWRISMSTFLNPNLVFFLNWIYNCWKCFNIKLNEAFLFLFLYSVLNKLGLMKTAISKVDSRFFVKVPVFCFLKTHRFWRRRKLNTFCFIFDWIKISNNQNQVNILKVRKRSGLSGLQKW